LSLIHTLQKKIHDRKKKIGSFFKPHKAFKGTVEQIIVPRTVSPLQHFYCDMGIWIQAHFSNSPSLVLISPVPKNKS
jgi:2-keto-4-pentenoate hydratase/2-oxohepta-3-ene-1,7-dioic acid hydratase in catechol pathway